MIFKKAFSFAGFALLSTISWAIPFHGVEFPQGATSFADAVVSYNPLAGGGPQPTDPYRIASEALGAPDYTEGPEDDYVSLGRGGEIILKFTDNSLTGSNNSDDDLWIFEVGPDVEDTFVWISTDGLAWNSVGKVTGSTRGIDIDAFGFDNLDFFSFVKLQDDPNEGDASGMTVGADIDAIGAISSAPPVEQPIPEPASLALISLGLAGLSAIRSRRRSSAR